MSMNMRQNSTPTKTKRAMAHICANMGTTLLWATLTSTTIAVRSGSVVSPRSARVAVVSPRHPTTSQTILTQKSGLDSNGPTNDRGYRPGTCVVHVVQYQKPDPSKDKYQIEISSLRDENETKIGGVGRSGPDVTMKSKLPNTIRVWTGNVDADPVKFHYGDQKWTSEDDNCSTGKYDSGNRDMDCTFKC